MKAEGFSVTSPPVVGPEDSKIVQANAAKREATQPVETRLETNVSPDDSRGRLEQVLLLAEERKKHQDRQRLKKLQVYGRNKTKELEIVKGTQLNKAA